MRDKLGFAIPQHIEKSWQRAEHEGREICAKIHQIKLTVEKAISQRDLIFREVNQGTVIELTNAWLALKQIIPYAVCPLCEGDDRRAQCLACCTRGFMSKFRYDRCIPQDVKAARLVRLAS